MSWCQKENELNDPPKFIVAPPKEKLPSLISPKKNKSLLSEDFFNPEIDFENSENSILMYGESEEFLDPGKRYENKLNRKSEKDKNPNQFKTDQYLGDFRNNGKFVQFLRND